MNKLFAYINGILAGELWLDDQNKFCFQYSKEWLGKQDSFHLSVSLPLQDKPFLNDSCYSYFTNLLPEAKILTALSRKIGIAEEDKFSWLLAEIVLAPFLFIPLMSITRDQMTTNMNLFQKRI